MIFGGAVGTALRLATDAAFPHSDNEFPLPTLVINVLGAFLLGLLVARVWPAAPAWLRAGLGAGMLGSFTTFSAVATALVSLTAASQWMTALSYLVMTLLFGLGAAALGLTLGNRVRR
ncbi:MAG: fluoride efflux transporter FluC [Rhodoglobus sp.]